MIEKHDDDLFKDSVMSFGEHLNELRGCLWRAILGLFIGVGLGFFFADAVVRLIQLPIENALKNYYRVVAVEELRKINPDAAPDDFARIEQQGMVFERVYVDPEDFAKAPGAFNSAPHSAVEVQPAPNLQPRGSPPPGLKEVLIWHSLNNDPRTRTKSLSSQEAFMIWLKAALIVGIVFSSPWVFYQVWNFVAAGLYPHERKYVYIYMPFSLALFLTGVFMSLFVFKPMLAFFFSFNRSLGIDPEPRISEWLSFVMILPLGFGLAFQLPLVMLFLERIGVFTVRSYLQQWRISVLVIWVIAALVTPADPYSIFLLALPMMGLFFFGIMLCKWWPRDRGK